MADMPPDRNRRAVAVLILLIAQAGLVHWVSARELAPPAPELARLPAQFAGWQRVREDPIAPEVAADLGATRSLSCTYGRAGGVEAGLFVAWFQSQVGGAAQPHSPKVCLPGSGWVPSDTGTLDLATSAGTIGVNRYLVAQNRSRAVVLYWYQTPRRVIAGEWAAKFWLIHDALRDRRTDTALVRVVVFSGAAGDPAAQSEAARFAADAYPELRRLF